MNTVAEMREVAKRMGLTGTSKLRKSDLYAAIQAGIETAHAEAIAENRTRVVRKIAAGYAESVKREGKSFTDRAITRALTYARQNGYTINDGEDVYPSQHFTARQRRRAAKKWAREYGQPVRLAS